MLWDRIKCDGLKCQHTDHCQRLEKFVPKLRSLSERLRKAISLDCDVDATTRNEWYFSGRPVRTWAAHGDGGDDDKKSF